jgi:hypothetical protein
VTGLLWLARHWPLATRCRIFARRTPVRPSELDPQGRSRRPVSCRLPVDFLESSRRCVAPLHPSPSLCPTFCGTLPACGSLRPRVGHRLVRAPQVDTHRGRRTPTRPSAPCCSLPATFWPSQDNIPVTIAHSASKTTAPSWAILCPHSPAAASWPPLPCRNRLPFLCRSHRCSTRMNMANIHLVLRRRI